MTTCVVLIDDGNPCGESPIWDAAVQKLYWTDCAGTFFCFDWNSHERTVLLHDFMVTGCALHECGGFTLINAAGVWRWDGHHAPALVASECDGDKLQLNDCIADPEGRLLAGSCFYHPSDAYLLGKLFSIQSNGRVRVLDDGLHLANGLGFSPDTKTLYVTDSVARVIYSYSYDSITGCVRDRKPFVQLGNSSGLPDGLTVDAEGFVWSAEWYGSCLCRYDPDGTLERRIEVPAKQTSSLAFGGPISETSSLRRLPRPNRCRSCLAATIP